MKKRKFRNQRLQKGCIDWSHPDNAMPVHIAVKEFPFHGPVLARLYGMSTSAIYYRLRQHGISLRSLRDGTYGHGKEVLDKYAVKNLNVTILNNAAETHEQLFKGKKQRKTRKKSA